jgi:nitrogenase iron protein NifH
MKKVVICGKGGIGKSTISTNVCVAAARRGLKVLQVGCDPKHDSCSRHRDGGVPTVMARFAETGRLGREDLATLLVEGRNGVHCIEAGGPQPGEGCAGRAISLLVDLLRECPELLAPFDLVVYDLLGDVVCGGFAAPIRTGKDTEVYLVASGEFLPVYAANNIARGVVHLAKRGGGSIGGVIANLRGTPGERPLLEQFAAALGTRIAGFVPRDPRVFEAELARRTVIEESPDSPAAVALSDLAATILATTRDDLVRPTPLADAALEEMYLRCMVEARR